ncbi:ArsJ-associated glyceraldehyde-3-phosphate dehydrogenase [Cognatishimia activa]|uniref:Glyceraldehyde-3-phosphate dehydrogenase n=1 Tax=Cognatishimia activa TaxID=1715691 RepID=A0A0P1IWH3_9RHOB|nr:ArsJ-associated glyceraldehyde-3-phosphate dehydrogenase [Cognatishimia activa]CUI84579.1 Glyceraldehyde-3-phosphate dehydrogenase 3 [Cognatishimia activa]CUK25707.1 Glyceraldehyde-3-phosphate dehydrogenase 3 [Cognatishimia activa]
MTKIAINGIGRMGKLVLRRLFDMGLGEHIVLLNDPFGDIDTHALLVEFDTVHGRWKGDVSHDAESITMNGQTMRFTQEMKPANLPLDGVDLVIECSGKFKTSETLQPYFDAGVKKVVISAPVKIEEALNIVYGVNHDLYDDQRIVTAASCTTNCIAPVVKVMLETFGIEQASFTTIHDVTNTQTIVDKVHKDPRRARSALNSLIPTTTGSAKAVVQIFPELAGRINGHAVRVPLLNASLTDIVFDVTRDVTEEEVNAAMEEAAKGALKDILGYEARPLVSCDFTDDDRSTIVDAPSTMVVNKRQVKIYAWYDNEWGYCCRLADITKMVAESL